MSQTEDVEALISGLVPFAEKMLKEHREFLPFGGHIKPDGEMVLDGAYDGEELPLSQDLIDILLGNFRQRAANHELRACAVVYDIRTIPPGKSKKQDAICVSIDHLSGYSAHVIYPYKFTLLGKLTVDEGYALHGDAAVFPRANA
ncbi:hypothetical protein [Lysobacter sp. M15]|uniref:hypothetical protein n=1 Tax=Lysobacter sp. M15 TaxID=2916837 RepID=UPI001F56599D|nr:hypothetical protein [Lysobacter sp. M15]